MKELDGKLTYGHNGHDHNDKNKKSAGGFVEVEVVRIKHRTDKAILVIQGSHSTRNYKEKWIPLSQVQDITSHADGTATIVIAEWIASKNDLEY